MSFLASFASSIVATAKNLLAHLRRR